jgi:hypothetical protein
MAEDFLKPRGMDTKALDKRRMEDGQFRNPPLFMDKLGGFTSAERGKFDRNKMTLEKSGPSSVKGRPI